MPSPPRPRRRGHLEPARHLGVQHHAVALLQQVGEVALGGRVVDNVLLDRSLGLGVASIGRIVICGFSRYSLSSAVMRLAARPFAGRTICRIKPTI